MITFLTALFGGVISAVITLVLGQPLQHYFWRRQRQAERQLVIIDEVNRLASEFMTNFLAHPKGCLTPDFFRQLRAAGANVNVLFSERTVQVFHRLEVLVTSYAPDQHLLGPRQDQNVDDFIQTQNDALRAWLMCSHRAERGIIDV